MSEALQLIIKTDGVTIYHPEAKATASFMTDEGGSLAGRLTEFCQQEKLTVNAVIFFLAEELLFYKTFDLPLETHDVKDAVGYQLGMLVPFLEESTLYSFVSHRSKESHRVTLVACKRHFVDTCFDEISKAGYTIMGLYPESQRYVSRSGRKGEWALIMQGGFAKALLFNGTRLKERLLCKHQPPYEELKSLCGTETIYHLTGGGGEPFLDAAQLLSQKPFLKDFNMLPASMRRPDFLKYGILALLALNLIALLAFAGSSLYHLITLENMVESQIAAVEPMVKELRQLQTREQQLETYLDSIKGVGTNPDLIAFMKKLSEQLPKTAYLDQLRMDKDQNAIHIQGFTDDISTLTTKLQEMGEAKLKSTSRRKDQTYFNMEIPMP